MRMLFAVLRQQPGQARQQRLAQGRPDRAWFASFFDVVPLPAVICSSVLVLLMAMCQAASADTPPNVVLIVSDDQGWHDYGFMGHPQIQTPRIDGLAAQSQVFTRGYVPTSLCRPSLASLLTGRYPHEHRICGNDPRLTLELAALNPRDRLADPQFQARRLLFSRNLDGLPALPVVLTTHGYLSHQSGKWWERSFRDGGFTHGMSHGDAEKAGRHGDEGLVIGRQTMRPVLDFLDEAQRQEKPFFVFYAPMMPHTPHNPPNRLLDKYRDKTSSLPQAKYWAMCEWFDESVGSLLDALDERKLSENTIVIYLADNGWTQPLDKEPLAFGAERGKRSQYDGGIRTPVMIRWPGHVEPSRDEQHVVSSIDILPTVLAATGIKAPGQLPGINLCDPTAVAARSVVYGEIYEHDATLPTKPEETLQHRWVVDGEWKLIVPQPQLADAQVELFHITEDPDEQHNLAGQNSEKVAELRQHLDEWWTPDAVSDSSDE